MEQFTEGENTREDIKNKLRFIHASALAAEKVPSRHAWAASRYTEVTVLT